MTKTANSKIDIKRIVGIAMFSALAFGVTFIFRIPVSFLTFDAKDALLTIASFIYGPIAAVLMSLIASILELTISDTAIIGALMNFVSSAAFSGTASLIYKYKRTLNGAIIGVFSSVAVTTAVMVVMNIFITPIYMGVPRSVVISMLPMLTVFNFAKSMMNGAIAMLLYKPVAIAMRRAKLISGQSMNTKFGRKSIVTIVVSALALAVAISLFLIIPKL